MKIKKGRDGMGMKIEGTLRDGGTLASRRPGNFFSEVFATFCNCKLKKLSIIDRERIVPSRNFRPGIGVDPYLYDCIVLQLIICYSKYDIKKLVR